MKRFLESLCLILLSAFLIIKIGGYYEDKAEEPTPDDEVVETPVESEYETASIHINGIGYYVKFLYNPGMTWEEVAEINDNIKIEDGFVSMLKNETNEFHKIATYIDGAATNLTPYDIVDVEAVFGPNN